MGDETWSYLCEDDMEARGVALLLDRQGLTFEKVQHSNGSVTFQCRGESGRKAAALEAEMLRHHAEQERADHGQRWVHRDRVRERRMRWIGVGVLLTLGAVGVWSC